MAKNTFDAEICDLVLCEAAESFWDEVNLTNKEQEAKTVEKFVDLCALLFLLAACKIVNFNVFSAACSSQSTSNPSLHDGSLVSPPEPLQMSVVSAAN